LFLLLLLLSSSLVLCVCAFSEDAAVVRIGVGVLRSGTDKVSVIEMRDRLVKALNHQKADKKQKITIQAVGLEESQGSKALEEAREKNCQFVLFSRLTDLQTSEKSVANGTSGGIDYVPAMTAKVAYQLVRVVDGAEYAVGSAKSEESSSIVDAVIDALRKVATSAVADLKKGGNVPLREPPPENTVAAHPPLKSIEVALIATDFCKWLPTDIWHPEALRGVCEYAISLPQKMPNFICDQETSRYWGDSKVPRDLITALVRYEEGNESYTEIKLNGKPAPRAISEAPGQWSTGEFGSNLRAIFDVRNQAVFEFSGENNLGGHAAWVFTYRIVKQNDPLWRLRTEDEMVAPPYEGELWVDQKSGDLLRFRSVAKEIPKDFPTQSAELQTDYDNVAFADGTAFVLPVAASVATRQQGEALKRNVLQFRNCHKFRAKTRMLLDVPVGVAAAEPSTVGGSSSDERDRELEENNEIYAILRKQGVREDAARLLAEQTQELNEAMDAVQKKMAALEESRRDAVALEASAKEVPPPATKEGLTTLKVSVRLVQVSVVPRDAEGRVVGSLRKEDFQLFDNGKPQVISSFSAAKTGEGTGADEQSSASSPGALLSPSNAPVAAGHDVAYVFDDIHATFGDLASARDAAKRHLEALRPEDRAAVFTTSGQLGLNFTADRQRLQDALKGLRPHPLASGVTCPPMTPYMADLIVNQDDRETLSVATQDAINCVSGGMGKSSPAELERAEQVAKSVAFEVLSASSSEAQSTLGILREVLQRTAVMPGARSMVLVSPGFLTMTLDTRQAIGDLIDSALHADIIVNTMDVRGLSTPVAAPNSSHPANPVARSRLDREETAARSDVMANLAYATGGMFFHNNNDLDEGFRRTADAPEYIYVLGFSPQKLDGKFHKLKVAVTAEEGNRPAGKNPGKLTVQARQGYYALRPETAR
jgi:VWFA-related protein